jgi:hypothetical protein
MAFKIPNLAQATNSNQAEPDSEDISILVAAYNGTGVISGCAVTPQGTPDMTVAVAAGVVVVGGTRATVSGGNVTITTADASNARFDLIVVNSSGTKSATAGTAAVEPVFPTIPATSVVLAAVYVPASDTSIEGNQIVDKRVINAIPVTQLDNGTDGELITWNASGVPATVAVGTVNYALVSGGTGVAPTFQVVPVAGGGTGVTTSTGTTNAVLSNSPTLVTPALGTPSALVLTSATGLPIAGLANGTDGELITWNASGVAAVVAVGTAEQVLTSGGAGVAPTFSTIVTVGALDSGSITSGFTSIDVGDGAITTTGTVTAGNLTVTGTTTTVNTATLSIEDPLIILASGNNAGDAVDIGLYGLYDTSGSLDLYSGLFRDANDAGKWKLFKDLQAVPTTTVNVSGTGYATGILVADLEGNVTGNVTGNASGTALTVTQAAQTAITSVGTLSALAVTGDVVQGTLTTGSGSITDSSGAITFVNENLATTGTLAAGTTTIGTLVVAAASITDTSGAISFGNENLSTSGTLGAGTTTIGTLVVAAASITDTSGSLSFGDENLSTTGTLDAGAITGTGLDINGAADISGALTLSGGDMDASDQNIANIKTATFALVNGGSASSGTIALNWATGMKQYVTLSGNVTITMAAPAGPCNVMLKIVHSGAGRTVTWNDAVTPIMWAAGTAPTLAGAAGTDIVAFFYDGTNFYGSASVLFS